MNLKYTMVCCALFSVTAAAEQNSVQMEVGVLNSITSIRQSHPDLVDVDDHSTGSAWSLLYGVNDKFKIEFGYLDQGEAQAVLKGDTLTPNQYHKAVRAVAPILAKGGVLGARYDVLQHDLWSVSLATGIFHWRNTIQSQMDNATLSTTIMDTSVYYGAHLQYELTPQWSVSFRARNYNMPKAVKEWGVAIGYRF